MKSLNPTIFSLPGPLRECGCFGFWCGYLAFEKAFLAFNTKGMLTLLPLGYYGQLCLFWSVFRCVAVLFAKRSVQVYIYL